MMSSVVWKRGPSVLKAREIGERIVERMKEYVEVFLRGMVAYVGSGV